MIECEILSKKGKFIKRTSNSFLVVCDDFGYLVNEKSPTFIKKAFSLIFKVKGEKRKRILFKKGAICSWNLKTLKIFV